MLYKIVTGNFDVEKFWKDEQFAELPFIKDKNTEYITEAMQELLFILCDEQDFLITTEPFQPDLKKYLHKIGFLFHAKTIPDRESEPFNQNIVKQIMKCNMLNDWNCSDAKLELFGILPDSFRLCSPLKISCDEVSLEVIKEMNSKNFSYKIRCELGVNYGSEVIHSANEFLTKGKEFIGNKGEFLIKDFFGVSGKGNLRIFSYNNLERIYRHLKRQEDCNKKCSFLLEEMLDREYDFSSVYEIKRDGKAELLTVQKILVDHLAYTGTITPDKDLIRQLERSGYFDTMKKTCEIMFKSGYYGYVCIDSAKLKDESFVPIIEINARYSMTQIKWLIDSRLDRNNQVSMLSYINVDKYQMEHYKEIIDQMKPLLYSREKPWGIIPLSANTMKPYFEKQSKGRFYYYLIGEEKQKVLKYNSHVKEVFQQNRQEIGENA